MTFVHHENVHISPERSCYTIAQPYDVLLNIRIPRRSQWADCRITLPRGVEVSPGSIFVNVIGRGWWPLEELHLQSSGRCGMGYERCVGYGHVETTPDGELCLHLRELDLRPDNGTDVQIRLEQAVFAESGRYALSVCAKLGDAGNTPVYYGQTALEAVCTVTDFQRVFPCSSIYTEKEIGSYQFRWSKVEDAQELRLLHSQDLGKSWEVFATLPPDSSCAEAGNLSPEKEHWFCLEVRGGRQAGRSNPAKLYSSMYNVRTQGHAPVDGSNGAEAINSAIAYVGSLGGGIVLFEGGTFCTTTLYLQSNVWLYIHSNAEIHALRGCDDEETCWFSDKEYRQDQTHMSGAPYLSPENWMTKQDAGHSYFHNALFFGQRLDNVKIVGNGRISGEGNLTKSNTVMEQESGNRTDKLIALKLCTNVEIGGLSVGKDLWYEETDTPNEDQPFYLNDEGKRDGRGIGNMLRIANAGHFAVLATGVDGISTHDIYSEKGALVRDIFDYMGCNDIMAFNIYAEGAPDDVVKLGSDCSLGFTRPSQNCIVRNIIGDTACNLFQIGSETADDIQNVCIDNLYVLGSNKAGFSISVNDGGQIRNVHLNCGGSMGHCRHGIQHHRLHIGYSPTKLLPRPSRMRRVRTPFFISLSNRGRTIGCEGQLKQFVDDIGVEREEMLVSNVQIGAIENVFLRNVDVQDMYAASQAKTPVGGRWPEYSGQPRTTAMIVGYKIPHGAGVTMPDGSTQRDIENVLLENIQITVKGGNPAKDADNTPRELGVGQFNLRNLAEDDRGSRIPAYGWYARHVRGLTMRNCTLAFEEEDGRYAVVLEDVKEAAVENLTAPENQREKVRIRRKDAYNV